MMLGKLPVPGRPTGLDYGGARTYCACSRCGWSCLDIVSLGYHFSLLSPSLGGGLILTEILSQRAVKPKTTNQPTKILFSEVKQGSKGGLSIRPIS